MNAFSWIESVWQVGMLYAVQSTILILGVIAVVRLGRIRDAAVLSMIYRFTMVAVVVSPMVTVGMKQSEIDGWWPSTPSQKASAETSASFSTRAIVAPDEFVTTGDGAPQGIGNDTMLNEPVVLAAVDSLPVFDVPPSELVRAEAAVETDAAETNDVVARSDAGAFFVCKAIAVTAWLVVSLALLIRHGRAFLSLRRSLKRSVPASSEIQALCDQMARELQVNPPRVVCSPYFESPFLSGVWSPVIHLCSDDDGIMEASDDGEVRDVLAHELAHLKRHDLIVRMVNHAVLSLLFFQPLLWRLVDWIEGTAEDVCDDFALGLGASRQSYARRLVDLAERCDFPLGSAVGIASGNSMLQHRVKRIMEDGRRLSMRSGLMARWSAILVSVAAVLVAGLSFTPAAIVSAGPPMDQEILQPVPSESTPPPEEKQPETDATAKMPTSSEVPLGAIRGMILGSDGPLANADVYWWRSRVGDDSPMQPVRVTTDRNGRFELKRTPPKPAQVATWDMREEMLVRAKGYAFEHTSPRKFGAVIPVNPDWPGQHNPLPSQGEPLRLSPEGRTVSGRLIDIEGQSIAEATVRIRWFSKRRLGRRNFYDNLQVRVQDFDKEKELTRDVASVVNTIEQIPLRNAMPKATTDMQGRFQLNELPADCFFELLIERKGFESTNLVVRNDAGNDMIVVPQAEGFKYNPPTKLYPPDFEAVIGPSSAVIGTVTDADTGLPIIGAFVQTNFVNNRPVMSTRDGPHRIGVTNATGQYRIDGLPSGAGNGFVVHGPRSLPYIPVVGKTSESNREPSSDQVYKMNFQLKRGIWAEGRAYESETGEPFQGEIAYYWFRNRDLEAAYPGSFRARISERNFTDSDGRYRIPVLPAPGVIALNTGNRDHKRMSVYSRGFGEFELAKYRSPDGSFPYYDTAPDYLMPGNYQRLALVDPKPDEQLVNVDLSINQAKPIPVTILNPDGKAATAELEIHGGNERWGWQDKLPQGFVVEDLLPDERRKVFAFDRSRGLIGGTIVEHGEGKKFEIKLSAGGRVHGRLVDVNGEPVNDVNISADYGESEDADEFAVWARVDGKRVNPSVIIPDGDGRFEMLGLSPKWKYSATVVREHQLIGHAFRSLEIQPGEDRDLGDIVIDASQD